MCEHEQSAIINDVGGDFLNQSSSRLRHAGPSDMEP